MSNATLLEQWREIAYNTETDKRQLERFWAEYFNIEKEIYIQLLETPDVEVRGSVKELAEKFELPVLTMVGFLDGVNDSLQKKNPIEEMTEDTEVALALDKELLYKNMVDAKADWLYELPQWESIFDEDTRRQLYLEQKKSGTVRKEKKVGRNEPCPCESGKKYKQCCGRKA
ncbi:MAG: SEC-C metal-binding domain-containing protein [Lachnospiraceae bacterium]|nr:SEC-C metal-binding domain-containing protein [Lachnospiraceae bacterium]